MPLIYRYLGFIPEQGKSFAQIRESFPELGTEKVRGLKEWANDLGLTYQTKQVTTLSPLGKLASEFENSPLESKLQEIMYYKLVTNPDMEVLTAFINNYIYEIYQTIERSFDVENAKNQVLRLIETKANFKYVRGEVSTAINALVDEKGISKLSLLTKIDQDRWRVNPYRPDWRSFGYMLYDSWPKNTARVRIREIINGQNSVGRIFFMTESNVMLLLSKLEQERAIALEIIADLNQVGLNPSMKAEDFLEMLAHDQN
jgi:hypothetical protein